MEKRPIGGVMTAFFLASIMFTLNQPSNAGELKIKKAEPMLLALGRRRDNDTGTGGGTTGSGAAGNESGTYDRTVPERSGTDTGTGMGTTESGSLGTEPDRSETGRGASGKAGSGTSIDGSTPSIRGTNPAGDTNRR